MSIAALQKLSVRPGAALLAALLLCSPALQAGVPQDIRLEAMDSGAMYVHASLSASAAAVDTSMLLDTGSGYVSLSRRTFEQVEHEPGTVFQRYITGIMADGKARQVPIYRVAELRLSEACVLRDLEVAVFHNADRDILGLNALKQIQPFTMQLDPPMLSANCASAS